MTQHVLVTKNTTLMTQSNGLALSSNDVGDHFSHQHSKRWNESSSI